MKYSIVIPTYNHCDDLLKPCIDSIFKYTNMRHIELIISANGCTDNTREYLNDLSSQFKSLGFEENLKIVWHDRPLGYSKATNVGIQAATTEYLLLLNNDTILLEQSKDLWLDMLVNPFTKNSRCGISCVIKGPSEPAGKDFAIFFCVMVHRKVFNKIGLLNEEYGVGGGEDTEFCIEAEKAGFEVCQCLDIVWSEGSSMFTGNFPIYHKGEGTMHDPTLVPEWNSIFLENSLKLAKKYNKDWYKWAISNHSERGVFFKGDSIYPRERFRYQFAENNLIGTTILEIGCSSGFGVQFLPEGIEYTGIDYDSEIIEAAKMQNWRPNIEFIQADIHEFPLKQYDTIIAYETIEHINNGLQVVEKLKQYCKKLIISVPYNENPGQFSSHHVLHNLTPESFKDFTVHGLIDINGNLLQDLINDGNEYNLLLSWTSENAKSYKDKLQFLEKQYPIVHKEIIVDNCYNVIEQQIKDKYVIDIGANIGVFSLLAGVWQAKKVFAIEPVTATFDQLCSNINTLELQNIIPMKNVVTDTDNEMIPISVTTESGHNSLYKESSNHENVLSISLKTILKSCVGNDVFLKIDCEGAEYDIILNAEQSDMDRISRIVMEIHTELHPTYKGYKILNDKLKSFGFILEDQKQMYTWDTTQTGDRVNWKEVPYRTEIWKK